MPIPAKDDYRVQQPRIAGFVQELNPGSTAEFDPKTDPHFQIVTRAIDRKTGKLLYASKDHWQYPDIADMRPEQIKALLRSWGAAQNK